MTSSLNTNLNWQRQIIPFHNVNKRTKFASCGKQIHSEVCQNIFVGYLYTLSVSALRSVDGMMIDELEGIWKETIGT